MIQTAQENIWKNELSQKYNEKFGLGADKVTKDKATKSALEKDAEYIKFLQDQLQ